MKDFDWLLSALFRLLIKNKSFFKILYFLALNWANQQRTAFPWGKGWNRLSNQSLVLASNSHARPITWPSFLFKRYLPRFPPPQWQFFCSYAMHRSLQEWVWGGLDCFRFQDNPMSSRSYTPHPPPILISSLPLSHLQCAISVFSW